MRAMNDVDIVVVGAGVVGLAIARELAAVGREVVILESEAAFGTGRQLPEQRSDPCRHLLPARFAQGTPLRRRAATSCTNTASRTASRIERCGKLIVATSEAQLEGAGPDSRSRARQRRRAARCCRRPEAQELEPLLHCTGALLSPNTGIVDSHAYMLSLLGEAEQRGRDACLRKSCDGCQHRWRWTSAFW